MMERFCLVIKRKVYLIFYLICTVLVILPTVPESSASSITKTVTECDPGWIEANGICYYWNDVDQVTFDEAHDECHARGSDMLTIHTSSEQEWLEVQTESYPTTGWWIGLKKQLTPTPQWKWLHGPVANNINWNTEPDNYDIQACVNINQFNKFSDDFCTSKYPYICKVNKKENEYCPIPTSDERWAYLMFACYWIADPANPAEFLTWSDAKDKCQTLNPLGRGQMHLLSITSSMEVDFFTSELPYRAGGVSTPWWTGLNDIDNKDFYVWEDGNTWNASMTPWDNAPSNGSDENCAVMYRAGVVDDFQCGGRSHFICQKSATKTKLIVGCPDHWIRGGHSCYLFANNSETTWSQARSVCQKGGGDLLKQDTVDKKYWISQQIIPSRGYWTGLNDRDTEGDYRWADGTKLNTQFIQWDKEPNNNVEDADCALIARDGTFDDVSCSQKQGYICEYVNDPGNKCLPGWISDGGSNCYYFSSTNITSLMMWNEVNQACLDQAHQYDDEQQTSYLCLDSKDEVTFINQQLANQPITDRRWWTGLNDRTVEGQWTWQRDYDTVVNVDLINWNKEPNNYNNEDCTILYQGGKYNDLDCNAKANYICEKTAGSNKSETKWWTVFILYLVSFSLS